MKKILAMSMAVLVLVGCLFAQSGTTLQVTKNKRKIVVQGLAYEELWSKAIEAVMVKCTIDSTDKTGGSISATKIRDWGDDTVAAMEGMVKPLPKLTLIVQKNENGSVTIMCRDSMGWENERFFKPFCKVLGVNPKTVSVIIEAK